MSKVLAAMTPSPATECCCTLLANEGARTVGHGIRRAKSTACRSGEICADPAIAGNASLGEVAGYRLCQSAARGRATMTGVTIERARNRWREILPRLGIEARFLTNKHGPCPLCGGRDRFRFDDKDGSGSYICGQCGAGVGIIMLRKKHGWTFKEACDRIDEIIGTDAKPKAAAPASKDDAGRRAAAIRQLLAEATSPEVVAAYLARRGLSDGSPVLRGHRRCPYFDDDRQLIGHYPAVLAPILGADGSLLSVQRIYDAPVEPRKKALAPFKGGAVRLA